MRLLRNVKKEKQLFERELEIWKEEQRLAAKEEVRKYKADRDKQIVKLAERCAEDTKEYEHTFHSTRETLGIELAKLEAKRDALKEIVSQDKTTYERIIKEKDAEIERLNTALMAAIEKDPQSVVIHTK